MLTIPLTVSEALEMLLDYQDELKCGEKPPFPHEADKIVREYQEQLVQSFREVANEYQ